MPRQFQEATIQQDSHGWHLLDNSQSYEFMERVATVYDCRERAVLYKNAPRMLEALTEIISAADGRTKTGSPVLRAIAETARNAIANHCQKGGAS